MSPHEKRENLDQKLPNGGPFAILLPMTFLVFEDQQEFIRKSANIRMSFIFTLPQPKCRGVC